MSTLTVGGKPKRTVHQPSYAKAKNNVSDKVSGQWLSRSNRTALLYFTYCLKILFFALTNLNSSDDFSFLQDADYVVHQRLLARRSSGLLPHIPRRSVLPGCGGPSRRSPREKEGHQIVWGQRDLEVDVLVCPREGVRIHGNRIPLPRIPGDDPILEWTVLCRTHLHRRRYLSWATVKDRDTG